MPESGTYGSVRGVLSNGHPYRDLALADLYTTEQNRLERTT
jgi:hypothetical protein